MAIKLLPLILITNLLLFLTTSSSATTAPCPPATTTPPPVPIPAPAPPPKCPKDTLKLGACVDLLGGLVHLVIGTPPSSECCALIKGLADVEAALCLCTVIKANVLGINLTVPLALSLLLSACEKTVPPGFKC
ncbi:Putative lipid-binding protein At4g00165 [Linum perenne]